MSVFVSDDFAEHLQSGAMPYIGRQMFSRWMQSKPLHLRDHDIGACNAANGVNVVTIHSGYRPFESVQEYADLRMSLVDVFIREHKGLHIRSFTHELYGEYAEAVSAGGLRVREYDPAEHPEIRDDHSGRVPFLTSLCRSGAADQRGNYLSDTMAFAFSKPRFRFSATQRQLLRIARENDSDDHIAERLRLSPAAIKRRWSTIYDRIDEIEPDLLGEEERVMGRRGQERRRKVIAFLRDSPEELHPYRARDESEAQPRMR